jgi:hypothetical protein
MEHLIAGSTPSFRSELDIFSVKPTDVSVQSSDFQQYYPLTSVKENENPLEFYVPGDNTHYLDLYSSYLYIQAKILKQNGADLAETELCAPGQLFFASMFQNCSVSLNGTNVFDSSNFYPYHGWIQRQLSCGESQKKTELTSEMYYKDTAPNTYTLAGNSGFKARFELSKKSKTFELIGRPYVNIFQQKRYIPNNVDMTLAFRRSSPKFSLSSATTSETGVTGSPFKWKIENAVLYIRKHVLHPELTLYTDQHFSRGQNAMYPINRVEVKSIAIPKSSLGTSGDVIFNGPLPHVLTMGLVSSKAFSGELDHSPFNFQHFKIKEIVVSVDGDSSVYRALNFNFEAGEYLNGYNTLFKALPYRGNGNFIQREDYETGGNVLAVFDIQPTAGPGRFQLPRSGRVKVEVRFKEALSDPVNLIVYGQFQSLIQIDRNRNVYVDTHG